MAKLGTYIRQLFWSIEKNSQVRKIELQWGLHIHRKFHSLNTFLIKEIDPKLSWSAEMESQVFRCLEFIGQAIWKDKATQKRDHRYLWWGSPQVEILAALSWKLHWSLSSKCLLIDKTVLTDYALLENAEAKAQTVWRDLTEHLGYSGEPYKGHTRE